ncbi:MAG: beta-galactosidase, partial [Lachnospiraceae bacterium]|nr:beta-galactosidase [Lachnospiraceae bacterium]
MIVPRHYENLEVLHEHTMPARAYYIPASVRMDTLVEQREDSDRIQILSGKWRFRYYRSIYDLTEPFYEQDFDVSSYDRIRVPGVWQMEGYDTHQYTNIRYPFPFDPPFVPQDNPCGTYVREFLYHVDKTAPRVYL